MVKLSSIHIIMQLFCVVIRILIFSKPNTLNDVCRADYTSDRPLSLPDDNRARQHLVFIGGNRLKVENARLAVHNNIYTRSYHDSQGKHSMHVRTSRPAIAGNPRCKNITSKSVHLTSLYHPTALTSTNDHLSVLRHYVCT